jgi:hypothetical protein
MANNTSTITIDAKTAEAFFLEIEAVEKALAALREKIIRFFPAKYGSRLWWEKSDKEALEGISRGRGIRFDNAKNALGYLHS